MSRRSGTDVALRGNGCVAADFDLDGRTDLYVTAAGYDALLWNQGNGRFVEGARAAGIDEYGWHTAATVGDVNGDGLPDLFVAGYADLNAPIASRAGDSFPLSYAGVRDRLYLNLGRDREGHVRFREVGRQAGIERTRVEHGLGAVFTDYDGDGRSDLYVANDLDPNRLYRNVPWTGGAKADPARLGFRLVERGVQEGVADRNAGMGVAAGDFDADGRQDLFVTNSHRQLHGVFASRAAGRFEDARPRFAGAFDTTLAGWGASWADLDLDGSLDLVVANGAIPVTDLMRDAEPVQVFENGRAGRFDDASGSVGVAAGPYLNGRGLAAADYDNDGDLDAAINSIGGPLVLLRNDGARGTLARGEAAAGSRRARASPPCCPPGGGWCARSRAGAATSPRKIRACTSGSDARGPCRELVVRYSGRPHDPASRRPRRSRRCGEAVARLSICPEAVRHSEDSGGVGASSCDERRRSHARTDGAPGDPRRRHREGAGVLGLALRLAVADVRGLAERVPHDAVLGHDRRRDLRARSGQQAWHACLLRRGRHQRRERARDGARRRGGRRAAGPRDGLVLDLQRTLRATSSGSGSTDPNASMPES